MTGPTLNGSAEELDDGGQPQEESSEFVPAAPTSRAIAPRFGASPTVQAAALAATTFVAGAATVVVLRRVSSARQLSSGKRRRSKKAADAVQVVASKSFLVDVHLIDRK
ncbi:MAG: hypothetical protein NTV40_05805 [Solirubrobacterales bacterium]|nr:hypothetical protein [Solirubrobacterales bacterium]